MNERHSPQTTTILMFLAMALLLANIGGDHSLLRELLALLR